MKCLTCGKPLPEYAKIINKQYCSQQCEDKRTTNNPIEELFRSFKK